MELTDTQLAALKLLDIRKERRIESEVEYLMDERFFYFWRYPGTKWVYCTGLNLSEQITIGKIIEIIGIENVKR